MIIEKMMKKVQQMLTHREDIEGFLAGGLLLILLTGANDNNVDKIISIIGEWIK